MSQGTRNKNDLLKFYSRKTVLDSQSSYIHSAAVKLGDKMDISIFFLMTVGI